MPRTSLVPGECTLAAPTSLRTPVLAKSQVNGHPAPQARSTGKAPLPSLSVPLSVTMSVRLTFPLLCLTSGQPPVQAAVLVHSAMAVHVCRSDRPVFPWQVFQRRNTGQLDFFKRWRTYVEGFGDPMKEFWLGIISGILGGLWGRGCFPLKGCAGSSRRPPTFRKTSQGQGQDTRGVCPPGCRSGHVAGKAVLCWARDGVGASQGVFTLCVSNSGPSPGPSRLRKVGPLGFGAVPRGSWLESLGSSGLPVSVGMAFSLLLRLERAADTHGE